MLQKKKSLISTVYILYNCSLTFSFSLLIKVKENAGEMFQCVFIGQEKLKPSFVYKYKVFWCRESAVFTGMLLKSIIIFLLSQALSTSAVRDQLRSGANDHGLVEVTWLLLVQCCDRWCCMIAGKHEKAVSSCTVQKPQTKIFWSKILSFTSWFFFFLSKVQIKAIKGE